MKRNTQRRWLAILAAGSLPAMFAPAQAQTGPGWQWWLGGEYLFLNRTTLDNTAVVSDPGTQPWLQPRLFSDDAHFNGRSGFSAFGGFSWDGGVSALEGSYLAAQTYRSGTASVFTGLDDLNPNWLPVITLDNFTSADAVQFDRKSSFFTFDIAYRQRLRDFLGAQATGSIGFRYAQFRDRLIYVSIDEIPTLSGDTGVYSARVRNHMFGLQTGLSLDRPLPEVWPGLSVKFDVKVAFLANQARNQQILFEDDESGTIAATKTRWSFATMVESGVKLVYELYPNVLLHGGYRFLFINGVATAPNNIGNLGGVNTGGQLLMHGPNVGLTVRFGDFRAAAASSAAARLPGPATWQVWGGAEYVFFQRTTGENRLLVTSLAPPFTQPIPTIYSDDVRFAGRSGVRAFGGMGDGRIALEGSYLYLATFHSSTASATNPFFALSFVPLALFPPSLTIATSMSIQREARFETFEVNLRGDTGFLWGMNTAVLGGFRYAHFSDRLLVSGAFLPFFTGDYTDRARNYLFGAQLGAVLDRPLPEIAPGLGVKLDAKLGLMANRARVDHFLSDVFVAQSAAASRTSIATLIDAGLQLTYEPFRNVQLHAGYRMMRVGGVATAVNNAGGFGAVNSSGTALFHGPVAGLTVKFGNY